MARKFLVGVANIYAYNKNTGALAFSSRTMMDTALSISTGNVEIRGGQGDGLQYVYFSTSALSINLTETQWNLAMVAENVGSQINIGSQVWVEESITLGVGGVGTVSKTPLVNPDVGGTTVYGDIINNDGTTTQVVFSGSDFTVVGGAENDVVCIRYYALDIASRTVDIPANFVPSNLRLVMDCQLASSDDTSVTGSSIIGKVQFEIPSAQLTGAQDISMTASGVSQTPLTAMALASQNTVGGCSGSGIYCKISELLENSNWYDTVTTLAIENSDLELGATYTETLIVRAISSDGYAFRVPNYSDLTFVSDTPATATVDTAGLVTGVAAGSANVTVGITAKPNVDEAVALVTVT